MLFALPLGSVIMSVNKIGGIVAGDCNGMIAGEVVGLDVGCNMGWGNIVVGRAGEIGVVVNIG